MSHRKSIYNKINKHKHIAEMLPLLFRIDDRTIQCKDGSLVSVIKITGKDYSGMSSDQYDAAYHARKHAFEANKDFVNVDIVSIKRKVKTDATFAHSDHFVLNLLNDAWQRNFQEVFRTSHYLILTTRNLSKLQKLGKLLDSSFNVNLNDELRSLGQDLMNQLGDYNPRYLERGELNSFFATLINGRETWTDNKILNDISFNQCLANQSVTFPKGANHCVYGKNGDHIYSGWLSVANYPDEPNQKTLQPIFSLPCEFIVYQSFQGKSERIVNELFKRRKNQIKQWGNNGVTLMEDLLDLEAKIENGDLSLIEHFFSLEVLAPTEEQLNKDISLISSRLETNGALYYRESLNIEALFWSRFPTQQNLNVRHCPITSENAAHFATFNSVGEGFDTCRFGERPVTLFKTESNSQFSFTFHNSPNVFGEPLGHTAFFGGTESGKTTLIQFLISQCLPFDDFKSVIFDRLHGCEVFTHLMDGDYLDFGKDVELNPFQMPDTQSNRVFLHGWLCRLLDIKDDEPELEMVIDKVVKTNFSIEDVKHRGFEALEDVFGADGSELRTRLRKWTKNGQLGAYFNGSRDSLNFDKQIVTFDATTVLEMSELLPSLTDYLFYRIYDTLTSHPTPMVIVLDEAQRYLMTEIFVKRAQEFANEIRKLLGVFCPIFQNAKKLSDLPNGTGTIIRDAMANFVVFPNRTADKKSYCDFLGLNDTEFEWVKSHDSKCRKVLFKRRESGESVVLDVDLKPLTTEHFKLLKTFSSGTTDVKKANELKELHPLDWKLKYLSS